MCGETRIPRDMCAGNTIPGETRIPMTPAVYASFFIINSNSRFCKNRFLSISLSCCLVSAPTLTQHRLHFLPKLNDAPSKNKNNLRRVKSALLVTICITDVLRCIFGCILRIYDLKI